MRWFKHLSAANTSKNLMKLRHKYGAVGYGLYWYCVELVAGDVSPNNLTFELEHDAEIISHELKIDQLRCQEMMVFMVELGLFENSNGAITCFKLARMLDETTSKSPYVRQLISELDAIKKAEKSGITQERVGNYSGATPESLGVAPTRLDKIRKDNIILSDFADAKITHQTRKVDKTPYSEIVELYNEICDHMPRVEKITAARKSQIRARHKDDLGESLERWEGFFNYVKNNCSWIGQPRENGKRLNLDWLIKEANYIKIKERVYDDQRR